ncbi:MAG TPA: hypothetical protein VK529_08465 [Gemmatimonadaceae bacterium]|jgi:hypothetical protein|nr:hypothetical protein [Gemmatimonadaceae bacterium]
MRIRTRAFVLIPNLLSLNVMVAQVAPPARSTSLIGTWEAVTRSAGGLGSTISFAPDNSMSFTLGAMVDMKYKRARDSLYIIDPANGVNAFRVSILRDTLVMVNQGKEQRETRVGAPLKGADPVIGRWTYLHYTGVPAFEEYTPGGDFRLRVPIRTLQGTYATMGDSAMMHLPGPGGGDRAVRFAVVGDTLELTWNGQTSRYVKATPLGRLIPSSSEHR